MTQLKHDYPLPWRVHPDDSRNDSIFDADVIVDATNPFVASVAGSSDLANRIVEAVNTHADRQWISVTERLPDMDERGYSEAVLVWPRPDAAEEVAGYYSEHTECFENRHGVPLTSNVTHWMPLPEGPPS